ncbi:uncharacterized protein [Drosophila virilis]|uniref:Uncharacterized protein, isoform M n=1 Tax=Drosophila virilis TaxID=7244 RepID=A0A0Q9W5P1_DROVI|nr:uncharacterized protein LOC6625339 isoform X7 [Drosophila virilis]KRF80114.1 uncharacterized protein Dvir_GJ20211, isoform M [Drosophila virilis]
MAGEIWDVLSGIFLMTIVLIWLFAKACQKANSTAEAPPQRANRSATRNANDRQNNVELGRQHNRFGDIFYIEPNSQEAARIREQLEKDDKELPSYDEVMRMCNLTTPTAAAALPTPTMESSAIGIAALPAPPYSECDPHLNVETPAATNAVTASTLEPSPSTSRAAQIPT